MRFFCKGMFLDSQSVLGFPLVIGQHLPTFEATGLLERVITIWDRETSKEYGWVSFRLPYTPLRSVPFWGHLLMLLVPKLD